MRHFAFPNVEVLNRAFIGCGRYTAAFDVPGDGYHLPASIIINKATVEQAVLFLTSETGMRGKSIYEKKDRLDKKYVGDSMHLAYFLALLHCSRSLQHAWQTDIWCTGSIMIADGDHPVLQEAGYEEEFTLKLAAFLAESNPDTLFLTPAGNIVPAHHVLCKTCHAHLISLQEFQNLPLSAIPEDKYIITIRSDELEEIIRIFFAPGKNPYKGLETFREEDAGQFFGREQILHDLWEKFVGINQAHAEQGAGQRFLSILGPSGVGKSSIIRAGLIPMLRERALSGDAPSRVLLMTTGPHPLGALARALVRLLSRQPGASGRTAGRLCHLATRPHEVEDILRRPNPHGEYDGLQQIVALLPESDSRPFVLVIDQGGEMYSQCQDDEERRQFIGNLLSASADQKRSISVIITLRSDFLEHTQATPDLNNAIVRNSAIIPAMNRTNLRKAIKKPAQLAGYRFSPEIVDQLIAETEGYMGALPLLQFTLTLLWEGIAQGISPDEMLTRIGGVGGAVADRAEKLYSTLEPGDRRIARKVFVDLVCPGEERTCYIRKRLLLSDIAAYADYREQVQRILHTFSGSHTRLVTLSVDSDGNATVELTHETLITRWGRLRSWLEIDRDFHTWRNGLGTAIRQWEKTQHDDGALLHGILLAEAQEWLKKRPYDLSIPEQDYIRKSQHFFRQEEERWKKLYEKERLSSLEAYHSSSRALFASHDELGALTAALKAGKIAQQLAIPAELKRQIITTLRNVVYGRHEYNRFEDHRSPVQSLSFNPDSSLLATGSYHGIIKLWDLTDGAVMFTLQAHSDIVRHVCFSPDGAQLASAGDDAIIRLWNVRDGRKLATLRGHTGKVYSLSFQPPHGELLASGGEDGTIRLWDMSEYKERTRFCGHSGSIFCLDFRHDGSILASGGEDATVKLWHIPKHREIITLSGHQQPVHALAFHPDGALLASGSDDRTLRLWDLANQQQHTLRGHAEGINSVAFSPDGTLLASGSGDKTLTLWNVVERSELMSFVGHQDEVLDVKFSSDGTMIASGSWDTTIKLWKIDQLKTTIFKGSGGSIHSMCFHPSEPILTSGGNGAGISIWDVSTGQKMATVSGHSDVIWSLALSPDGKFLASGSGDHTIRLWAVEDGRHLRTLSGHTEAVFSVSFSPDSNFLASGGADHRIKLWNVADGREALTWTEPAEAVWSVAFHPHNRILASGGSGKDNTIRLWDLEKGQQIFMLQVPDWPPAKSGIRLAFSPDGKILASGSNGNGSIILWEAETFEELTTFHGHTQTILSLAFSPDSTLLASGSADNTVKIWNVATGRELTTLRDHSNDVRYVTFSPDGKLLASGGLDNTIRLWNVSEQCHFQLDELLERGHKWVEQYLRQHSVSQ